MDKTKKQKDGESVNGEAEDTEGMSDYTRQRVSALPKDIFEHGSGMIKGFNRNPPKPLYERGARGIFRLPLSKILLAKLWS